MLFLRYVFCVQTECPSHLGTCSRTVPTEAPWRFLMSSFNWTYLSLLLTPQSPFQVPQDLRRPPVHLSIYEVGGRSEDSSLEGALRVLLEP